MPENKLRIAVTCSSNMNRSMEAHSVLSKKGFCVKSFGTGDKVKLPGTAIDKPNVYDFSYTYDEIYCDLVKKDRAFYTQNGLLHMLDRNRRIKARPEKFQHCEDEFDLIITCEERVYDQVIDYFNSKIPQDNTPVHIINVDIQDNQEEATIGAFFICQLVEVFAALRKAAETKLKMTFSKNRLRVGVLFHANFKRVKIKENILGKIIILSN